RPRVARPGRGGTDRADGGTAVRARTTTDGGTAAGGGAWAGVDVAAGWLDAAVGDGAPWRVGNDAAGVSELAARLAAEAVAGVVLEATGGYEAAAIAALQAAGVPVARADPRRVGEVARA